MCDLCIDGMGFPCEGCGCRICKDIEGRHDTLLPPEPATYHHDEWLCPACYEEYYTLVEADASDTDALLATDE